MHEAVYEKLKQVARVRSVITYGEIASLAGLGITNPRHPRLAQILAEICAYEVQQGHPMLGAVVVRKADNIPGEGFFKLARSLGRFQGDDKLAFWNGELDKVYNYW